jgi:hypothetical protein
MRHPDDLVTLFGTPAFVYAEVPKMIERWIVAVCRRRDSFFYGNKLRHLLSYIAESWRRDRRENAGSAIRQLARFAVSYPRKASRRFARALSRCPRSGAARSAPAEPIAEYEARLVETAGSSRPRSSLRRARSSSAIRA